MSGDYISREAWTGRAMYDELIKSLREDHGKQYFARDMEAADAIEELQAQLMFSNDAAKAIAEKVPRWIPVTERLPEPNTRVIGFMAWKAMTAIEYQNGKWYSIDHLEPLPDEAVTHWMPLPEPPEEVKK